MKMFDLIMKKNFSFLHLLSIAGIVAATYTAYYHYQYTVSRNDTAQIVMDGTNLGEACMKNAGKTNTYRLALIEYREKAIKAVNSLILRVEDLHAKAVDLQARCGDKCADMYPKGL